MSGVNNRDQTQARRIRTLKRKIDASLMELTEVEVVINARCHQRPIEGGELEKKRLLLTSFIVEMDAKLARLQAQSPGAQTRAPADLIKDGQYVRSAEEKHSFERRKTDPHSYRD